jgi:hypothetical protein
MLKDFSDSNVYRPKEDGSLDSICLACLATIATGSAEDGAEEKSQSHVCDFSFGSIRSSHRTRHT